MLNKTRRKAIEKAIEENLDYLVRFAYYRLGNLTDAEDLVFDAILRLLEKNISAIAPPAIRLYLFRIVYNMCVDRSRTIRLDTIPIENVEVSNGEYSDSEHDIEDANHINTILDGLPQRETEIIRMHVTDELSFVEIGSILSVPVSTVKSRYKSGMDKLRKKLSQHTNS